MGNNHWLVKSEPFKYSWEKFLKDKKTFWDGVRNYQARNNLRTMQKGDQVFFYHSNEGLEIVGIAEVVKEAYQDPTIDDERWVAVDLKPVTTLKAPVSLAQIKAEKRLQDLGLIRQGRLSVSPVTAKEWEVILELSEQNATESKSAPKAAPAFSKVAKKTSAVSKAKQETTKSANSKVKAK
ncbi:Predicted RNA-binding protein, contains PUA-like domain [Arachidicoccus rhizosphaerae]|uniref:Predicted RNA-binding protein, contains PUA-like domain n=1 Tax=Arachidicoccus rhizosphaerae TaxID=551991 RepID=A0A1H3Z585_9BACT|nr:EVE domain-containing protein [Arachidicoccus rhizosphaerae]SEA18827.1 Predicted RNA-binding protein, contains PUA-like domain [Arachidicoccus rhizosphaerae]